MDNELKEKYSIPNCNGNGEFDIVDYESKCSLYSTAGIFYFIFFLQKRFLAAITAIPAAAAKIKIKT